MTNSSLPAVLLAALIVVHAVVAVVVALPAAGQEPDEPVDLGRYAGPLRFEVADGGVLELADGRRFAGALEVLLSPAGGLVAVNDIDIETYVEGIAEMPARWPMEALKAQAVAARTYAWYQATRNAFAGYDICDTTACQVFRGREVVETPEVGERWAEAVAATAGEVLLYEDAPILARYFSTSGGHTFNNEDVFSSSGAFPYLVGVPDPDDAVSPVHTWRAEFSREQFDTIALRGTELPDVVPVADVERVPQPDPTPDRIVVTGANGATVDITAGELRDFLNAAAPTAFPDHFPGPRADGLRLPSTVPSGRYEVEVTDEAITLVGSGWGHGVGMGQWGAMGKADRGLSHAEILAAYYNGLEPTASSELPDRIRVGLSRIDDSVAITSTSVFTISTGDQVLIERGLGAFTIDAAADRTIALTAPPGHGAPLVLSQVAPSRTRPFLVEQVTLDVVTNKPVELLLRARPGDGDVITLPLGVAEPGRQALAWTLDDSAGAPIDADVWEVEVVAIDEEGEQATAAASLEVLDVGGDPAASVLPDAESRSEPETPLAVLLASAVVATLGGLMMGRLVRRHREHGHG